MGKKIERGAPNPKKQQSALKHNVFDNTEMQGGTIIVVTVTMVTQKENKSCTLTPKNIKIPFDDILY